MCQCLIALMRVKFTIKKNILRPKENDVQILGKYAKNRSLAQGSIEM